MNLQPSDKWLAVYLAVIYYCKKIIWGDLEKITDKFIYLKMHFSPFTGILIAFKATLKLTFSNTGGDHV